MRFYGMMHFWLGIQYDFVSDCFIIGLLFIYIRIPKEKIWRFKQNMKIKHHTIAGVLALSLLSAQPSGCAADTSDPCKTVKAYIDASKCVKVNFHALFENRTIPKAVGHYTYGPTQQKLSSTSGVIDKNELVMPGAYVDMYVAPERTDAFGLISGKITARDKQVIDACNNHGHGAAECAGTVPLK